MGCQVCVWRSNHCLVLLVVSLNCNISFQHWQLIRMLRTKTKFLGFKQWLTLLKTLLHSEYSSSALWWCHKGLISRPETLREKCKFWKGIFTQQSFTKSGFLPTSRQVEAQHCGLISWKNSAAFVLTPLIHSWLQWKSLKWGNSRTLKIKNNSAGGRKILKGRHRENTRCVAVLTGNTRRWMEVLKTRCQKFGRYRLQRWLKVQQSDSEPRGSVPAPLDLNPC